MGYNDVFQGGPAGYGAPFTDPFNTSGYNTPDIYGPQQPGYGYYEDEY